MWMRYDVASPRNTSLMPDRVFVAGSKTSWRRPLTNVPLSALMKKFDVFTDARSIGPVNGTSTRGWRSNPSSVFSSAKASQIEKSASVHDGCTTPPTFG